MRVVIQRVMRATLNVHNTEPIHINQGFVLLVGFEKNDKQADVRASVKKILSLRVFEDRQRKMNLNISDVKGDILIVPNFTLGANTKKGNRPSFDTAMLPEQAHVLFDYMSDLLSSQSTLTIQKGIFGADMKVEIINDGPVTFVCEHNDVKDVSHE